MYKRFQNWLPDTQAMDDQARAAALLRLGLGFALALSLLYSSVVVAVLPQFALSLLPVAAMVGGALVGLWLLHQGEIRLTSMLVAICAWGMVTLSAFVFGSVKETVFVGYVVVILFASLILSNRAVIVFAAASLLTWLGLVYGDTHAVLPPPIFALNEAYSWLTAILAFAFAMLFLHLIIRNSSRSLGLAHDRERALVETIELLRATTISKDYLDKIIQSMADSVVVADSDGIIKTVNLATLELLGYDEEELIGKPLDMLFAEGAFHEGSVVILRSQGFMNRRNRVYRAKDGRKIRVSFSGRVMNDEQGNVIGNVCVAEDITERLRMEQEIQRQHDFAMRVMNALGQGLTVTDASGRFEYVNPAYGRMVGYPSEQIIGKQPRDFTLADDYPTLEQAQREHQAGHTSIYETRLQHRDGTVVHALITGVPRSDDAQAGGTIAVVTDLTERKQIEEQLNQHVSQLNLLRRVDNELSRTLDLDQVLTIALDIAMRLSGASAGAIRQIEGDHIHPIKHVGYPQDLNTLELSPNAGIAGRVIRQDSAERVCDVLADPDYVALLPETRAQIAIPLRSNDRAVGVLWLETNKPHRFTPEMFEFLQLMTVRFAIAMDSAQLYTVAQQQLYELKDLYMQVSGLEQLKTNMIRIAAHDLRNPLTIIGLSSRMLQTKLWDHLDAKQQNHLENIQNAADQMQRITTNILSLERIEKAAAGDFTDPIDLQTITEQAYRELRPHADEKRLDYLLNLPDQPLMVAGDSVELHEAISNLISNAIKYTPAEGSVCISLQSTSEGVILEVQDSGFGIPENQQARLFQAFFRVRSRETSSVEGTGLGLHLVKNIIERHKGKMRFHSVYGEGSLFGFALPLLSAPVPEGVQPAGVAAPPT